MSTRGRLRRRAEELAHGQDGIAARRQLREWGLHRRDVRTELDARRWQRPSPNTVAMFTGPLTARQHWWVALLETGCADAALDGPTALAAAGLVGFESPTTISCPHGTEPRRHDGVVLRVTRWRRPGDSYDAGIPRVRPAAATIRAALWAGTDRQAALLLLMAVQQRLTTAGRLRWELARIARHPRRRLVVRILADIADGATALGELDFAMLCRQHQLPRPSRQAVRRGQHGRVYLDVYFDAYRLVVEIDGSHHWAGITPVDDALRENELTLDADLVLRIPLLGLRIQPAEFMAQVTRGLRERGWDQAA